MQRNERLRKKKKITSNTKEIKATSLEERQRPLSNLIKKETSFFLLIIIVSSFILYFPVMENDFHRWDDDVYVRQNERIQKGINFENIVWAFSTNYFGFYYPMTWLSHMADCQIYGLNPKGHYFTNILIHSLNSVLLFFLLFLATHSGVRSFIVSMLFSLHPMNVESVAWIAERKNLLSSFFLLLALICYILKFNENLNQNKRTLFGFCCFLFFILGLMSKTSIIMFPVLLLILDFWPLKRVSFEISNFVNHWKSLIQIILEKLSYFVISLIFGIITIVSQKEITAMEPLSEVTILDRLGESLLGYGFYLKKFFLPFNLCVLYPHHKGNYPIYLPVIIFIIIIALTTFFVFLSKIKPSWISGWLFFLISLLPVIGLLQTGLQAYADRYVYFPYWGLFIAIVFGIDFNEKIRQNSLAKYLGSFVLLLIFLYLFVIARKQIGTWKNDETLFQNVMKVCPDAFIAPFQLGFVEKSRGNFEKAKYYYEKSLEIAEGYIRRRPESGRAYHDKANALLMLERYDEAIEYFEKAIKYGFNEKDNREKIELAKKFKLKQYVAEGKRLSEEKKWDEAEKEFRKALEIAPDSAELWSYLGYIMEQKNDLDEARIAFEKALSINPLFDTAIYNLAIVELKKSEIDKVEERLKLLEKLNSPYADQLKNFLELQ